MKFSFPSIVSEYWWRDLFFDQSFCGGASTDNMLNTIVIVDNARINKLIVSIYINRMNV